MVVFKEVNKEELLGFLKKQKFTPLEPKTVYEDIRYFKGVNKNKIMLILYTSGKLLIQGNEDKIEDFSHKLESVGIGNKVKKINFRKELGWVIGSDESLKGDTFGGLIVAGVRADEELRTKLKEIGVADSKVLRDREIFRMAQEIKKICSCEIINLTPQEYNHKVKMYGSSKLLNDMHKQVGKFLLPGTHVVDKYPGCSVGDIREIKAEHKYLEVAAASILARAAALDQINFLSKKAGFPVPKGSTHVKWGLEELKEKGLKFEEFVKLHFKNVDEFVKKK